MKKRPRNVWLFLIFCYSCTLLSMHDSNEQFQEWKHDLKIIKYDIENLQMLVNFFDSFMHDKQQFIINHIEDIVYELSEITYHSQIVADSIYYKCPYLMQKALSLLYKAYKPFQG